MPDSGSLTTTLSVFVLLSKIATPSTNVFSFVAELYRVIQLVRSSAEQLSLI
jgi:hypothetical protein